MKLTHWLNQTVIISRLTAVSGDKIAMTTVTACQGHLQPLDAERTGLIGGVYGKTYRIWVDTSVTIQDGDKLKDDDGNFYKVKKGGVTTRSFGSIDYKEILIEKTS
ncbi:MAG: hypothetical protein UV20_C0009G0021 [Candidatus Magasanikbacteria bacterium GW2011_GWA2_42_32]|uniref:Uncharacterized protein n=1 Tax=Candidatus Magasanikbacteria bacterium GW2011_GWA2_42_32 TaxID=1619039 RepID=A0A0G1A634_9BACT|nr:MAG: hypothetical protein UV20_C0009G0021 [Candidatus Magasanikbacteria bacterium GW2011_GWA2_42_32]HBX15904.1 hypothetical protein [Candidatus Magasanikbacteria bacterium]